MKKVKRSLVHTYGDRNLNQQEFTTAIKRVASVLNSRPIYAMMGPKGVQIQTICVASLLTCL